MRRGKPNPNKTGIPPSKPAYIPKMVRTGVNKMPATTRWTTRNWTGDKPIVWRAFSSSFTFIVPSSAAKAEPERPASMIAAITGPSSRDITRPNKLATNTCAPSWAKGCADSKAITMPTRNVINDTMGSALTPATSKTRKISFQRRRRGRTRPFITPSVTSPMNSTCWRKSRSHEPVAAPTSSTKGEQAGSCSRNARKSSVEKLRKRC